MSIKNIKYEELLDCDNFIIGNNEQKEFISFGYRIPEVCAYMKEAGKNFEELTEDELAKFKADKPYLNTLELIKELRIKGVTKCPLCNVGNFVAVKGIPVEKQIKFQCDHCKEKIFLHLKYN